MIDANNYKADESAIDEARPLWLREAILRLKSNNNRNEACVPEMKKTILRLDADSSSNEARPRSMRVGLTTKNVEPSQTLEAYLIRMRTKRHDTNSLRSLPGLIEVTTSKDKPDVVTFEDGVCPKRAVMPCGHALSSNSMREYCESLLNSDKIEMKCPSCSRLWPWKLVRHVTCYSDTDWKEIEMKLENMKLMKDPNRLQCPGCKKWLKKAVNKRGGKLMVCSDCTERTGSRFKFCPDCFHITSKRTCSSCLSRAEEREEILNSCPDVPIGFLISPSVRACPNCGLLIHFTGGCKHVCCKKCSCDFCFICLEFSPPGKEFCPHLAIRCALAPRPSC